MTMVVLVTVVAVAKRERVKKEKKSDKKPGELIITASYRERYASGPVVRPGATRVVFRDPCIFLGLGPTPPWRSFTPVTAIKRHRR